MDTPIAGSPLKLCVFSSEVGWCGLVGTGHAVATLTIGHENREQVLAAVYRTVLDTFFDWAMSPGAQDAPPHEDPELVESDWNPALRRRLQEYSAGARDEFHDVDTALPQATPFQCRVLAATRRIAYGSTATYAELAARAGHHRAARAVGNTMASNRVPIIIPCHRVVASGGKLGGYSAPQGLELKKLLLSLESSNSSGE